MPTMTKLAIGILLSVVVTAVPATMAFGACVPEAPDESCTVHGMYEHFYRKSLKAQVAREVATPNAALGAPSSFASDLHASFQNFLPLFAFAISKVEESDDGQALIIRWNPLRHGTNLFGATLTVSEPTVAESLRKAIPEDDRSSVVERLETELDDLDDTTISLSYTRTSATCTKERIEKKRCWGRSPTLYQDLLSEVFVNAAKDAMESVADDFDLQRKLLRQLEDAGTEIGDASVFGAHLPAATLARDEVVKTIELMASADAAGDKARAEQLSSSGLQHLETLIDNQPQLAFTASYRDPGSLGGSDEMSLALEFQFGGRNLNSLFHGSDDIERALEGVNPAALQDGKWVVTATYKENKAFSRDELSISTDDGRTEPVEGFMPIDDDGFADFIAKVQWGTEMNAKVGARNVRFDLALDSVWTDDDERRPDNRVTGSATFTLPLGDQVSLPLSLNYSDKPRFLSDQRDTLGVHFGLTYRLPWEGEN